MIAPWPAVGIAVVSAPSTPPIASEVGKPECEIRGRLLRRHEMLQLFAPVQYDIDGILGAERLFH